MRERLAKTAAALLPATTLKEPQLTQATERAIAALEDFRRAPEEKLPTLPQQSGLGRDAYLFFLHNVALMPFTPEELLAMGRHE